LPQIVSWPGDGGAFITLPQVITQAPGDNGIMRSNVGMYRIQMSGNEYAVDREVGMHYQLHRGIGVHHRAYLKSAEPFRASIFVGGPPSHALAAIFPLPEGLSELTFAGMLSNRRFRYHKRDGYIISNDADFVITGTITKRGKKPEGPFGDHLGYYSLKHDFPIFRVDGVYHRKDPLWHFTVVGRPPQEDSGFGHLIHLLVGPLLANEFPGVKEINAVDVAGVHPLLLAIGSERYMPFRDPQPEEILTQANHILGSGQTSLAKYLWIAAATDEEPPTVHDERKFIQFVLQRIDWRRDLHFQTKTTIDTLDYSGTGWNQGSKVVMACCGSPIRKLTDQIPENLALPPDFVNPMCADPGILLVKGPAYSNDTHGLETIDRLARFLIEQSLIGIALIVVVDDPKFCCQHFSNFLWVTFTRSNPSHDIHGVDSFIEHKHWGCRGPVIIDARSKPHHAPVLEEDPTVTAKVDQIFSKNGSLSHLNV
jgi:4-hydroxy-3-polyprenylbenzoate decarboxylase